MAKLLDVATSFDKDKEIAVLFPGEYCFLLDSGFMHLSKETELQLKNLDIKWDYMTLYDRQVIIKVPTSKELIVLVGFANALVIR